MNNPQVKFQSSLRYRIALQRQMLKTTCASHDNKVLFVRRKSLAQTFLAPHITALKYFSMSRRFNDTHRSEAIMRKGKMYTRE